MRQGPSAPVFEAVRTRYRWGFAWFFSFSVAFAAGVSWLWMLQDAGPRLSPRELVIPVSVTVAWVVLMARLPGAVLRVDPDGSLTERYVRRRRVALSRLVEVETVPSVPYPDESRQGVWISGFFRFVLADDRGGRLGLNRGGVPWVDYRPVVRQVVAAVRVTGTRVSPACWRALHEQAGLAPAPVPEWMTEPPQDGWGRALQPQRSSRYHSGILQLQAWTGVPLLFGLIVIMVAIPEQQTSALRDLVVGVLVTGVCWLLLWGFLRRGQRATVRVDADGRVSQVRRSGLLGLRLRPGSVVVGAGTTLGVRARRGRDREGRAFTWVLEIADAQGGFVAIDLLHEHSPQAVLMPQLAFHLERQQVAVDAATRHAIELRLGRALAVPAASA